MCQKGQMEIAEIEKIRAFTSGDIVRGVRNQICGVAFTKGKTSFEFIFGERTSRLALRVQSEGMTLHFEFPGNEIEEVGSPHNGSTLIFRESKSGEQLLTLSRSESGYLVDPIVPFLATEARGETDSEVGQGSDGICRNGAGGDF